MAKQTEPNPALVPQDAEAEPQAKTYKVTGTQAVFEHKPGETFEATLDPQQEGLLLEYGHLTEVAKEDQTQTEGAALESPGGDEAQQEPKATEGKE